MGNTISPELLARCGQKWSDLMSRDHGVASTAVEHRIEGGWRRIAILPMGRDGLHIALGHPASANARLRKGDPN